MQNLRLISDELNKEILSDFNEIEISNMKEYLLKIIDKVEDLQ